MKHRTRAALVGIAALAGAAGMASAAHADATPTNYRDAGDCRALSTLTWNTGGMQAVGQVPCNLRHSTTDVKVSIINAGTSRIVTYGNYSYRNSLGTGGLRLTAPGGGWTVAPSGCGTYYALTEASISGIGYWSARSNARTLCF